MTQSTEQKKALLEFKDLLKRVREIVKNGVEIPPQTAEAANMRDNLKARYKSASEEIDAIVEEHYNLGGPRLRVMWPG